ncbi:MAG: MotA/TolQ/ExbB proton channel family protein [Chromatiales bacterium]|jgi:hypothetical protein|nr:MotA/TolQ/ExbB proton channel family protein [Chromatiales bacterium]
MSPDQPAITTSERAPDVEKIAPAPGALAKPNLLIPEHPFRALLQWAAWTLIVIGVVTLLYITTGLLDNIVHDHSGVTLVIVLMFLIGFLLSFFLTLALTREAKQAISLGRSIRERGVDGVIPRLSRYATHRFFAAIKVGMASDRPPDPDPLIELETNGYYRRSEAVGIIGNLLITLGLIGTVLGLTLTLAGLSTSIDSLGQDQEKLIHGLEDAMKGMSIAFYTTLLGAVFGGVLLRIYAMITNSGIGDLSDTLKRISIYCTHDIRPTAERDMRRLNAEITMLTSNCRELQQALGDTAAAMHAFRDTAANLHQLANDGDEGEKTMRDALVLQMYYADLLREEVKVMNKVNRAWWPRLHRALRRIGRQG